MPIWSMAGLSLSAALDRGVLLWGSVCHHVKRGGEPASSYLRSAGAARAAPLAPLRVTANRPAHHSCAAPSPRGCSLSSARPTHPRPARVGRSSTSPRSTPRFSSSARAPPGDGSCPISYLIRLLDVRLAEHDARPGSDGPAGTVGGAKTRVKGRLKVLS